MINALWCLHSRYLSLKVESIRRSHSDFIGCGYCTGRIKVGHNAYQSDYHASNESFENSKR